MWGGGGERTWNSAGEVGGRWRVCLSGTGSGGGLRSTSPNVMRKAQGQGREAQLCVAVDRRRWFRCEDGGGEKKR